MGIQVLLQPALHHVGRQQERQLPEFRQPPGIRHAFLAAVQQRVGRSIHDFDLFGLQQELFRHAVRRALRGDAFHLILLLFDVLDVDGRDDADAAVEQLPDVLPALRIAAAGGVVVG